VINGTSAFVFYANVCHAYKLLKLTCRNGNQLHVMVMSLIVYTPFF